MTEFKKKQGKANRAAGKRFELKVRADLENAGWIVFRNSNDVEGVGSPLAAFKQAKTKWNFFTKMPMSMQSGFPDFVCIRLWFEDEGYGLPEQHFKAQFIECKVNGTLTKEERDKVDWIKNNLHMPVSIASRGEKRGTIKYELK